MITLPANSVSISGSGSDADGTIVGYKWKKISGPSAYGIVNATLPATDINNLVQGSYQFELQVTDNDGASARDTLEITVNEAANIAPTAYAGSDKIITLPKLYIWGFLKESSIMPGPFSSYISFTQILRQGLNFRANKITVFRASEAWPVIYYV